MPQKPYNAHGLDDWFEVSKAHARNEPCPPVHHYRLPFSQLRNQVEQALRIYLPPPFVRDCRGREVYTDPQLVAKLLAKNDDNHLAYFGWIAYTIQNPIEIWDTIDDQDPRRPFRRLYFSAYKGINTINTQMAVVNKVGFVLTAYRLRTVGQANGLRASDTTPPYTCY